MVVAAPYDVVHSDERLVFNGREVATVVDVPDRRVTVSAAISAASAPYVAKMAARISGLNRLAGLD
jgi:hypothetical protein